MEPIPRLVVPADPDILLGGDVLGDALERLSAAVRPVRSVGGWATVELDRAATEVAGLLGAPDPSGPRVDPAPDDTLLGARCRVLRSADERTIVLLEPSTEGHLAAALARHGEGSVVCYLLADVDAPTRARAAGFRLTRVGPGPFGPQRLVVGPRWGPFLILVSLR